METERAPKKPTRKIIGDHEAIIAVDIDGTLNDEKINVMSCRTPDSRFLNLLKAFGDRGYTVILYTSRDISRHRETKDWLFKHGFLQGAHYYDIVFNKLKYDYIIDSRAFNSLSGMNDEIIPKETDEISELMEFYLG